MDWDYSGRKRTFVSCRILTEKTNAPIKLFNQQENPFEKHINISAYLLGCANKDLDGSLGPMGKFIEYCRIVALLPGIPYTQRNN